ncbi:MAG: thioesterase domain-containing protein [Acidimicrobiales bacterium]
MASQVVALVAELAARRLVEAGPFHLVGYSMGGRVALTVACTDPTALVSLSLVGGRPG